jgi:hypothetical protein
VERFAQCSVRDAEQQTDHEEAGDEDPPHPGERDYGREDSAGLVMMAEREVAPNRLKIDCRLVDYEGEQK